MCNSKGCLKEIQFENITDLINSVPQPQKFKNSQGGDLFGYPSDELYKAALYYSFYIRNLKFGDAQQILTQIKYSVAIEELSLFFKNALFKDANRVPFLKGKTDIREIVLELYSQFSKMSINKISELINNRFEIYAMKWREIVQDEDDVTLEQLGQFYNSLIFPVDCTFLYCTEHNLSLAYKAFPILLAKGNNFRRVFDFGGNSGLTTSAMANSLDLEQCLLIEESEPLLSFAKWRNDLFNIHNVQYIKESSLIENIHNYNEYFELGICTEVLEHVFDVDETIDTIYKLLKKKGILYQSTSFGLPMASHLKKNIKFAGQEDQLMLHHGFQRLNVEFPIPLLSNTRIYQKM